MEFPSLTGWMENGVYVYQTADTSHSTWGWNNCSLIAFLREFDESHDLSKPGKKTKQNKKKHCFQNDLNHLSVWSLHKGEWHTSKYKEFSFPFKF